LGKYRIRSNAILPGAVASPGIDIVLRGRADANGTPLEQERQNAMAVQLAIGCDAQKNINFYTAILGIRLAGYTSAKA